MLRKLKNNNTGAFTSWQRGWMLLVLFCVFTFALDVCMLGIEMLTMSHQMAYMAEKLSFQGGFRGQGGDGATIWSNRDFYNYLGRSLRRFGINGNKGTWSLSCDGGHVMGTNGCDDGYRNSEKTGYGSISYGYGVEHKINLNIQQPWFFSSRVFPFLSGVRSYNLSERFYSLYLNG